MQHIIMINNPLIYSKLYSIVMQHIIMINNPLIYSKLYSIIQYCSLDCSQDFIFSIVMQHIIMINNPLITVNYTVLSCSISSWSITLWFTVNYTVLRRISSPRTKLLAARCECLHLIKINSSALWLDESAHESLAASCEELRARTGNPPLYSTVVSTVVYKSHLIWTQLSSCSCINLTKV